MELLAFLLTFVMLLKQSWSLQCYRCEPERQLYVSNISMCQHFDYSSKYVYDCPASTMCYKKITSYSIGNGMTTQGVQRGCAPQTLKGDQRKINGKWEPLNNIYEVYTEGCSEDPSDSERLTKTTFCYCRGDLCNSAHRTVAFGMLSVMLGFLIMS